MALISRRERAGCPGAFHHAHIDVVLSGPTGPNATVTLTHGVTSDVITPHANFDLSSPLLDFFGNDAGLVVPHESRVAFGVFCGDGCAAYDVDNINVRYFAGIGDTDNDGVVDSADDCPNTVSGADVDAAGCSDAQVDDDGDGFCDVGAPSGGPSGCTGTDNCPAVANPDQENLDGDAFGDACDDDGDGVPDTIDNCPTVANGDQTDSNGDGFGDACVDPSVDIPGNADVDPTVTIGAGSDVEKGSTIGPGVVIGENVIVNQNVSIGANSEVGNNVILSRGATIGENVMIGADVFIGQKAIIEDGVFIGNMVTISRGVHIAAGTTIVTTINDGAFIGQNSVVCGEAQVGMNSTIGKNNIVQTGEIVADGANVGANPGTGPDPTDCN